MRPAILLSALVFCACATPGYLARVNGEPITRADLQSEFTRTHSGHTKLLFTGESEVRQFLNATIDRRLFMQEAYRIGLDGQPTIKALSDEFLLKREVEQLEKDEIDAKAEVAPADVQAVYDTKLDDVYVCWQIFVPTRAQAEDVIAKLKAGAEFEKLARELSYAQSRLHGGKLPPIGWGMMEPAWEDVVFNLKPGELSAPIETKDGFEVVKLESKEKAPPKPAFAQVGRKIKDALHRRKLEARRVAFAQELWAKYQAKRVDADVSVRALIKPESDATVATWTGGSLGLKELASRVELQNVAMLPPERQPAQMDQVIRALVQEHLLKLEAPARKYELIPDIANAVRFFREEKMETELFDTYVLRDVDVPEAEVAKYYEEHKAELIVPEKRKVAQIVVESEERAKALRQKIRDGEKFEALVRSSSKDSQSIAHGGDLGWVEKKEAPKDFEVIFKLEKDDVSEPIHSEYGWHLIKVNAIAPERQQALEEAKPEIAKKIFRKKAETVRNDWMAKLRSVAKVEISDRAIRKVAEEVPKPDAQN